MYKEEYENEIDNEKQLIYEGKTYTIQYAHFPNYVRRSEFNGRPIIVGRTWAYCEVDGVKFEVLADCWVKDAFTPEKGEYVTTGRLLKKMGLPTILADQLGKY